MILQPPAPGNDSRFNAAATVKEPVRIKVTFQLFLTFPFSFNQERVRDVILRDMPFEEYKKMVDRLGKHAIDQLQRELGPERYDALPFATDKKSGKNESNQITIHSYQQYFSTILLVLFYSNLYMLNLYPTSMLNTLIIFKNALFPIK